MPSFPSFRRALPADINKESTVTMGLGVLAAANPVVVATAYTWNRWAFVERTRSEIARLEKLVRTFRRMEETADRELGQQLVVAKAKQKSCLARWENLERVFETTWFPYIRFQEVRDEFARASRETNDLHGDVTGLRKKEIEVMEKIIDDIIKSKV